MSFKDEEIEHSVTYVHRRIGHHASHSGYNTVFESMNLNRAHSKYMEYLIKLIPTSVRWRLNLFRPQPVGDQGLIPELLALSSVRSNNEGICHFIYGEDTYFYTAAWKGNKQKIIATYHYPPDRLVERVSIPVLKTLDAVILMASNQLAFFKKYFPEDRIFVVHHHVDTDFFKPSFDCVPHDNKVHIVSVGGILRDMDLLARTIESLSDALGAENVVFDLLVPSEYDSLFDCYENVVLHSKITDEELRSLYQSATLGFMPLVDCTANNAVLEMMACGLPLVCSGVGGIEDYIDHEGAMIFSPDTRAYNIAKWIVSLLGDKKRLREMAVHNREKAVDEFSLEKTAEKLVNVYVCVKRAGDRNHV